MATSITEPPMLDELIERLGVPLSRILAQPAPGTATEADLLEAERRYGRLYELVDGVLVEKAMGYRESILAGAFIRILGTFVVARNLGVVSAATVRFDSFRVSSGFLMSPSPPGIAFRKARFPKSRSRPLHPILPSKFSVSRTPRRR